MLANILVISLYCVLFCYMIFKEWPPLEVSKNPIVKKRYDKINIPKNRKRSKKSISPEYFQIRDNERAKIKDTSRTNGLIFSKEDSEPINNILDERIFEVNQEQFQIEMNNIGYQDTENPAILSSNIGETRSDSYNDQNKLKFEELVELKSFADKENIHSTEIKYNSTENDESDSKKENKSSAEMNNCFSRNKNKCYIQREKRGTCNLLHEIFKSNNIILYQNSKKFKNYDQLIKKVEKHKKGVEIKENSLILSGTVDFYFNNVRVCKKMAGEMTHGLTKQIPDVNYRTRAMVSQECVVLPIGRYSFNKKLINLFLKDLTEIAIQFGCFDEISDIFRESDVQPVELRDKNNYFHKTRSELPKTVINNFLFAHFTDVHLLLSTVNWKIQYNKNISADSILSRPISKTLSLTYMVKKSIYEYFRGKNRRSPKLIELKKQKKKVIVSFKNIIKNENAKNIHLRNMIIKNVIYWTRQLFFLSSSHDLSLDSVLYYNSRYEEKSENSTLIFSKYRNSSSLIQFLEQDCNILIVGEEVPSDYTIETIYFADTVQFCSVIVNNRSFKIRCSIKGSIIVLNEYDMKNLISHLFDLNFNLILSSGGAKGIVHCGIIKYLEMMNCLIFESDLKQLFSINEKNNFISDSYSKERILPLNTIGGTSIGALIACLYEKENHIEILRDCCYSLPYRSIAKNWIYERFMNYSLYDDFLKNIFKIPGKKTNIFPWMICTDLKGYKTVIFCKDCSVCDELNENKIFHEVVEKDQIDFFCMKCSELEEWKIVRASTTITQLLKSVRIKVGDRDLVLVDGAYTLSLPVLLGNSLVIDVGSVPFSEGILSEMMRTEFFLSSIRWKKALKIINEKNNTVITKNRRSKTHSGENKFFSETENQVFNTEGETYKNNTNLFDIISTIKSEKYLRSELKNKLRKKPITYLRIDTDQNCLDFITSFDKMINLGFKHGKEELMYFGALPRRWSI